MVYGIVYGIDYGIDYDIVYGIVYIWNIKKTNKSLFGLGVIEYYLYKKNTKQNPNLFFLEENIKEIIKRINLVEWRF
jgi:hypothetical protein